MLVAFEAGLLLFARYCIFFLFYSCFFQAWNSAVRQAWRRIQTDDPVHALARAMREGRGDAVMVKPQWNMPVPGEMTCHVMWCGVMWCAVM